MRGTRGHVAALRFLTVQVGECGTMELMMDDLIRSHDTGKPRLPSKTTETLVKGLELDLSAEGVKRRRIREVEPNIFARNFMHSVGTRVKSERRARGHGPLMECNESIFWRRKYSSPGATYIDFLLKCAVVWNHPGKQHC